METPEAPPRVVPLATLADELDRLDFLVNPKVESIRRQEEALSIRAGELIGKVYDLLLPNYIDPTSAETLRYLNMLCVRIVFCLYADDAGLFGKRGFFFRYFEPLIKMPEIFRLELIRLFRVLNTPHDERDPYERAFAKLPYVNGGLFDIASAEAYAWQVPVFSPEAIHALMIDASEGFDWSGISPTIFGAVFESTLNPETRRTGGMHYTSVENIHRVIDPLFLDCLRDEFDNLKAITEPRRRRREREERELWLHEQERAHRARVQQSPPHINTTGTALPSFTPKKPLRLMTSIMPKTILMRHKPKRTH